jgi:capsular exopolysaccharide synthesis family protein
MSRIHEALQRAEAERTSPLKLDEASDPYDLTAPAVCNPVLLHEPIDFDDLPRIPWKPSLPELPSLADRGKFVEEFRNLRSQLHLQRIQQDLKTVLVTSGLPAEGKTFIAVNLAMSLAHNSAQNVLLIDADLRKPSVHKLLGASPSPGLADYLEGKATVTDIIQRSVSAQRGDIHQRDYSNVAFISAGKCNDNAPELICSDRINELMSQVSPFFDWIIFDSPPVLVVTDAVDLGRIVDGILLVARAGSTPYAVAQKTQHALSNSRLLGFVLNAVSGAPRNDPYYSYYYDDPLSSDASKWKRIKRTRK